jgi:hypothetical protein
MSTFPILLGAIVIDDDTDGVYLDEAGVGIQCTLVHGTYYLKGDGAADDFCLALKTALEAGGANTYTVTIESGGAPTWSRSPAAVAATVTVSRSAGTDTFRIRWNHANTTFGSTLLGFVTEKGAADANAESSTQSPLAVWIGDNLHEDAREAPAWVVSEQELENGDVDVTRHSERMTDIVIDLPMLADANLFTSHETVTNRSLDAFIQANGDGRPVQFHEQALQSGSTTLIDDLSSSTLRGTYRLGREAHDALRNSSRAQLGMRYSDLTLTLRSYVAP